MTARTILATAAALVGLLAAPGTARPQPQPEPKAGAPELTTRLGKPVYARPDADRAIAKADAALAADPTNVDLILAAARARDAALQFRAAIALYTRGLERAPADVRLLRFRGHRYISVRDFDRAVADLQKAAEIAPSSFDVTYHLALAHYLAGNYDAAARVYRSCLDYAGQPGQLPEGWRSCMTTKATPNDRVAMSDWLYRSLRRAGRHDEAKALAADVADGLTVGENEAYYTALRFYRGAVSETDAMEPKTKNENRLVTVGYGVATFHLANGDRARACQLLTKIANEPNWNAFGVIAAEIDLTRTPKICQ
jgi:tetratricopeptide (TPR) repeat protein